MPVLLNKLLNFKFFSDEFDLEFGLGKTVTLRPTGKPHWPIAALTTETIDNQEWIRLGALTIAIPEFQFNGTEWSVTGLKTNGLRKFGIPLKPLKFLLKTCQVPAVFYESLPDSFPLEDIQLSAATLSDDIPRLIGKTAVQNINSLLQAFNTNLSEILNQLSEQINKLPSHFLEYLTFDPPDSLELDMSVTNSGGTNISFKADPNHPLRLLLPFPGIPPGLMGVTVSE